MSRLLGWHAVLAMLCLLSFTTERTAMAQLLLDENVLAFPISVRKSHNTECSPMRSAWLFCDDFENERPGAYIEQRHKAQQRVLGVGVLSSNALVTSFEANILPPKAILKIGFSAVPNERFNPLNIAANKVFEEIHVRFYIKLSPHWQALPSTIVSIGSILSPAWQEGMRSSVVVDERGYLGVAAFSGYDPRLDTFVSRTFDDGRLLPVAQAASTIHVGSDSFAGTWHLIETLVRLDSTVDAHGGSHHLFVDSELVASIEHVAYHAKKMTYGLNAVYLHATMQQAPSRTQIMLVDNLVVSTQRVGIPGVRPDEVPSWPGAKIQLATPLVNSHVAVVDLSQANDHAALLAHCWKSRFYFMFVDETCHLAWLYQLQSAQLVVFQQRGSPPPPPPSLAGHGAHAYTKYQTHGLIQVRLPDEMEGFFLGCDDTDGPSYKAELLAYHVDRLLGIDRVPATVARSVTEDEARRGLGDRAVIAQLKACAPDDVMRVVGSLSGWPHEDIESTDIVSDYIHEHSYQNGAATPNEIEVSRLIIGLLLQGLPRKIQTDSIIDVEEPEKGKKSARHLFINPSNSMARWDAWAPLKPAVPACNRTSARGTTFTCRIRLPSLDKSERVNSTSFAHNEQVANGALISYLRTACIFPKTVAMRLYHYAADHVSLADTLARVTRAELTSATSLKRFHGSILDKRLYDIFLAMGECVALYGHRSTIFDDPVSFRAHAPPKVHVDPAGARYWKNETTGVWMKLQKAVDGLPEVALDEAPFLVAAAPFADLACHVRDECGACLASPKCKWCLRERICGDAKSECAAGITVTSANGCPADALPLPDEVLPYELPIEAPETPAPTTESNADYLALFGGDNSGGKSEKEKW